MKKHVITKEQERLMTVEDDFLVNKILGFFGSCQICHKNEIYKDAIKDYHSRNALADSNDGMGMAIIGIYLLYESFTGREQILFSKKKRPSDFYRMKNNFFEMLEKLNK